MQKRLRKTKATKRTDDLNQIAHQLVARSTGATGSKPQKQSNVRLPARSELSRIMAAMGSKGGKIGGKRRAERMTPEERSKAAAEASRARWSKENGDGGGS